LWQHLLIGLTHKAIAAKGTNLHRRFFMMVQSKTLIDFTKGLKFTESPRWHDGRLWFLDIHDKSIKSVNVEGDLNTVVELPFIPNGFGVTKDGKVLVGDAQQRRIHRWDGTALQQVADISGLAKICLSDGIVTSDGGMYVGDIGFNFLDSAVKPVPEGVIIYVAPNGQASVVADKIFFPNGIVIVPDGKTLIVGETLGHRLTAFDIASDGSLGNRRVWAQVPDDVSPDGICLDSEQAVWVAAAAGQVVRVREGGEITQRIEVARTAYAVMLGGPERRHLFICTSGSHDPAEIHENPSASIEVVEVEVAGAGTP
jgi:sugar lactone lactonase YvrE